MTVSVQPLRFGTRASRLARWQTERITSSLQDIHVVLECRALLISTEGDRDRSTPLPEIGGKGLFTEALERALLSRQIDVAVHSLKDLPTDDRPGLVLGAICFRADARDVLVSRNGWTLATLPRGARVGTSSNRRMAQLNAVRPDLELVPLRGNVDTRVRKALEGQTDAVVLAAAGVQRLGLQDTVSEYLPLERMLPAPGQGALAVQCRAVDQRVRDLVAVLEEPDVRAAVDAERAFLSGLGGGCAAPIAAYARTTDGNGTLELLGCVAALGGRRSIRVQGSGPGREAKALGRRLAEEALARGAAALLP